MEERDYWIAWSGCPGIGPVRFNQLLKVFSIKQNGAERAWNANESALRDLKWTEELIKKVSDYRRSWDYGRVKDEMEKWGIQAVTQLDERYPSALKEIGQAPLVLYVMEHGAKEQKSKTEILLLAVVGTRKVTGYGRQVTEMLVKGLVDVGVGIVSGLMYGVDEVAHRTCMAVGGYTVGVWAGGLDTLFQGSRKGLAELVVKNGGTLLSEYPLGMPPSAQTFPYRNRIVAGLSCGVLVTEGTEGSGTLITAGYAAEQSKEVFAVPGPITSQQSQATSTLIKAGAKVVTGVGDILDELKVQNSKLKTGREKGEGGKESLKDLSLEERKIWELLKNEAMSLDEISRALKKPAGEVGSCLSMMELQGWVRRNGEQWAIK